MSDNKFAKDKHHIIPRSRFPKKKGLDPNHPDNIVEIKTHLHRKYHTLFSNKTPEEIIDFLVNYFWKGQRCHVEDWMKKQVHLEQFNDIFKTKEVL